jgi:hypothetical protein
VAPQESLPLRQGSATLIAGGIKVKKESGSRGRRYDIFTRMAAPMTDKDLEACAQRLSLSRSYDLLAEDVAQARVDSFLDAQIEALLTPDPEG